MKKILFLVLLLGLGYEAPAQPTEPGPEPMDTPATVPLDGGAGLLLASGVAYGLRRLRQRRHPNL